MGTLAEAMEQASVSLLSDEELIVPINNILTINPETRIISVPETEIMLGVYYDKDVERKYFKCPKIVGDNIDLSLHEIYIRFMKSTDSTGKKFDTTKEPHFYKCSDVEEDETGNYITFSWKLGSEVFENGEGYVAFSVFAMDGDITRWNTIPAVGVVSTNIPGGIEIGTSVNTQDANATEQNMESGYTAYVKGKKIEGAIELEKSVFNLLSTNNIISNEGSVSYSEATEGVASKPRSITISYNPTLGSEEKVLINKNTKISASARASKFGNAKPENVEEGITFTSEYGVNLIGTKSVEGIQRKSGTIELADVAEQIVIDTGLTNIKTLIVKKPSETVSMTYIWVISETLNLTIYRTQYLNSITTSSYVDINGGTATCKQYTSDYPLKAGTYTWEAYGE